MEYGNDIRAKVSLIFRYRITKLFLLFKNKINKRRKVK